jgi:hypothetical protein
LTHNALLQVLLVMQNTPQLASDLGGLKLGALGVNGSSRFDLVLFINTPATDPSTMWVYNPNLFDATMITRFAGTYEHLLGLATSNQQITVASLVFGT